MKALVVMALAATAGCGPAAPTPTLDRAALLRPETCRECHPDHFKQWSGSMHAYADTDPVFRAMNARGQRETNGMLGSFCVNCHAPLAVRAGATTDGLNLDTVAPELRGVTCFFCHTADQVTGDHNAPVHLADDLTLRGGISDPVANTAHRATYSSIHDRQSKDSASLCGSCHDIVNPLGTALERTYAEWQGSIYSQDDPRSLRTCGKCHMSGTEGVIVAQYPGVKVRTYHDHTFDGVDVALAAFPDADEQAAAITRDLTTALSAKLCVMPNAGETDLVVTLDNVAVGHGWPSGATQDRRAWVELIATARGQPLYASGAVADGGDVTALADPDLWLLRDRIFDGTGKEVHMFWQAASYQSAQLGASVTNDPHDPRYFHAVSRTWAVKGTPPDHVTMRVRLQAIGADVLDDLVKSGDLDAAVKAKVPTYDLGSTVLEWKAAGGFGCVP